MLLNQSPGLRWLLQVRLLIFLDDGEASRELAASNDVEASLNLLFGVFV